MFYVQEAWRHSRYSALEADGTSYTREIGVRGGGILHRLHRINGIARSFSG